MNKNEGIENNAVIDIFRKCQNLNKKEKNKMLRKFEFVERVKSTGYEMKEPGFDLPKRSTKKSMAYDFYSPEDFELKPKEAYMLKTGVKAYMSDDEGLILNVRSSIGKKHIMLANTSAWIDSDFYNNPNNEGEIGLMFYNYGDETWKVNKNDRVAQAMFVKYLITDDDNTTAERVSGIGSTGV